MVPTHNTDSLLGIACLLHQRSVIFRREFPRLAAVVDRSKEIFRGFGEYNQQAHVWRMKPDPWSRDGRSIEFGAVQYEDDKGNYQGRPHDLICFDELPEFTESQYLFLQGWCRTTDRGQRCRVIGAGNPPLTSEGTWVMRRWAPWLDPRHPRPAMPGELRWFARDPEGREHEVAGPGPIVRDGHETIHPKSRTFIPARLADNPYNDTVSYRAYLGALPEPLRSKLLAGDFSSAVDDDALQVIPTAWVLAAQERWTPAAPRVDGQEVPVSSVGVDVARGGRDQTVIIKRRGVWIAPPVEIPGRDTPTGQDVAAAIVRELAGEDGKPPVHIDSNGVGASALDFAGPLCNAVGINTVTATTQRDRTGNLSFCNLKALLWWRLRELLDPSYGENAALPPHPMLRADLCSCRWSVSARGIQIESKDEVKKRIGRSPDVGDALVLSLADMTGPSVSLVGPEEPDASEDWRGIDNPAAWD